MSDDSELMRAVRRDGQFSALQRICVHFDLPVEDWEGLTTDRVVVELEKHIRDEVKARSGVNDGSVVDASGRRV